ncbi:hypothetical protein AM274_08475 [Pseudomonas nunensis]|nr:hypothetical protein AM274_08475 [Pseudomonas nunensis]
MTEAVGMAVIGATGITPVVTMDVIIGVDVAMVATVAEAGVVTADISNSQQQKSGALSAAFFVPGFQ